MTTHIERLQAQVAQAAQEAALLEVQARVAAETAATAKARALALACDLEAALRAQSLEVLRAGWQSQAVTFRRLEAEYRQ
jgi:hypothetical protein